jgi:beta-phosphoglucomutase-like phosphatase (HAD superfamily)
MSISDLLDEHKKHMKNWGGTAPDLFLKAEQFLSLAPKYCLVIEVAGMHTIAVAGERDLPRLRAAELMVKSLTQVTVETIRKIA